MPSAARAAAAIALAILGAYVSTLIIPLLPEGTDPGYFIYVNLALGAIVGWKSVGTRVGRGWTAAVNAGLTGGVLLVLWGLFVQGTNEMVARALKNRYDGPMEAIAAIFEIGIDFSLIMATPTIIATLVAGSIITGLLSEIAGRMYR